MIGPSPSLQLGVTHNHIWYMEHCLTFFSSEASLLFRAWKTIWLQSPQPLGEKYEIDEDRCYSKKSDEFNNRGLRCEKSDQRCPFNDTDNDIRKQYLEFRVSYCILILILSMWSYVDITRCLARKCSWTTVCRNYKRRIIHTEFCPMIYVIIWNHLFWSAVMTSRVALFDLTQGSNCKDWYRTWQFHQS